MHKANIKYKIFIIIILLDFTVFANLRIIIITKILKIITPLIMK